MDAVTSRILDVNLNRSREGLRVVEDFARFALDDSELCGSIKQIRHDLSAATRRWTAAVFHRDTPGDVGTAISTATERERTDLAAVVTAAGKRVGEAMRVLEEVAKIKDPVAAGALEGLRYRWYEIERVVALILAGLATGAKLSQVRLHVLVTESLCSAPWLKVAEAAIDGGAGCIQLREKSMPAGELLVRARQLVALCRARGVVSIINDRPDVAILSGADGVHLGQDDVPVTQVRKLAGGGPGGAELIVGASTHDLAQARRAVTDGASYLGVGPVFPSATKPRDILPGPEFAHDAARLSVHTVAIGGINAHNAASVAATGVSAVAVCAAVISSADPKAAAEEILRSLGPAAGGATGT